MKISSVGEIDKLVTVDKSELVKLLDKSKIDTEDLKDYLETKTKSMGIKTNDRKTVCRLITNYLKKV